MHDLEEKLRCLELDMLIAATFDIAPVSILQTVFDSTSTSVLPFLLPGSFDSSFLTFPSAVG